MKYFKEISVIPTPWTIFFSTSSLFSSGQGEEKSCLHKETTTTKMQTSDQKNPQTTTNNNNREIEKSPSC